MYDKETGLYFLKSRYYDPEIGRFTTKDRFMGFEDVPASQNPYIYCGNNPVNNFDPNGESWLSIAGAALGVVGFVIGVVALASTAPIWGVALGVVTVLTIGVNTAAWLNDEYTNKQFIAVQAATLITHSKGPLSYQKAASGSLLAYGMAGNYHAKKEIDWSRGKRIFNKVSRKVKQMRNNFSKPLKK